MDHSPGDAGWQSESNKEPPGNLPAAGGLGAGFGGGGSVVPAVPPEGEHPPALDAPPLSFPRSLTFSSGNFGAGIFYSFNNFILPFYLSSLGASVILINLLSSTRSLEGSIIQPTVGAWSDRIWTRLGRRRPFILAFVPLSALFIALTPLIAPPGTGQAQEATCGAGSTASVGAAWSAPLILATMGIFLFSVLFNVMYDPYNSLLADITPIRQRGRVNGIFQAAGALGQVSILLVGVFLNVNVVELFLLCAVALVTFFVPTILGVREPRQLPGVTGHHRYTLRDYWNGLKADRQVFYFFAVQFFLWFGINAVTPNLSLYATCEAGFSKQGALVLSFILLLSTALFVWPFGVLSDRLGLKRIFLFGMLCMAGASIAGVFTRDPLLLYVILTVAGIGNAAQTAASYPLLTRIVFPDRMGLYTGLNTSVTSVAAPLSAIIAGTIIQQVGYSAMFPFVAAMFLAALVPLALLRVERSQAAQTRAALAIAARKV